MAPFDRQHSSSCWLRTNECLLRGRSSVTKLVNTIFWKVKSRFQCKLAQVVGKARTIIIFGLRGKKSKVKVTRGRI